ncbi:MAG: DnaJ domain-containing protein [Spirochaetaceae bacterium]|jgi:DnaJ-domain-containing protein 1|nr:DnaJ domain-containing protein [Spirochaetaceae bacterium]
MLKKDMGVFKNLERVLSSYIDDFFQSSDRIHQTEKNSFYNDDLNAAHDELNEFLNNGYNSAYGFDNPRQSRREKPAEHILKKDFDELGVSSGAPLSECKKAYRALIKIYHPDKSGSPDSEKFMRIETAYKRIKEWYSN